jgi:hypothetical protein
MCALEGETIMSTKKISKKASEKKAAEQREKWREQARARRAAAKVPRLSAKESDKARAALKAEATRDGGKIAVAAKRFTNFQSATGATTVVDDKGRPVAVERRPSMDFTAAIGMTLSDLCEIIEAGGFDVVLRIESISQLTELLLAADHLGGRRPAAQEGAGS